MSWRRHPRAPQKFSRSLSSSIGLRHRSFPRPARSTWHHLSFVIVADDDMVSLQNLHVKVAALRSCELACIVVRDLNRGSRNAPDERHDINFNQQDYR
jgi:hypothetical protein